MGGLPAIAKEKISDFEKIYLLQFFVRGFRFTEATHLVHQLKAGQLLHLEREPANQYDQYAIALYSDDWKIGYVPRESNEVLARLMDAQAIELLAEIVQVNPRAETWENINAAVYILKAEESKAPKRADYLSKTKPPKYVTVKNGDKISKIQVDEEKTSQAPNLGTYFYQEMLKKSNSDAVYNLIHESFKGSQAFEEAVSDGMFLINPSKINTFLLEKIKTTESLLEVEIDEIRYYLASTNEILIHQVNEIKQIHRLPSHQALQNVLYEIVFS